MVSGSEVWSQDFSYDIWGNMEIPAAVNAPMLAVSVDANNQISDTGFDYDAAGNMTVTPSVPGLLVYDAENRLVQVGADIFYTYDGDGARVLKVVGSDRTVYFRSALSGQVLEEWVNGVRDKFYISVPSTDGRRATWQTPNYSRGQTQSLVNILHGTGQAPSVLFNDQQVSGSTPWPGHDNHLHARFPCNPGGP